MSASRFTKRFVRLFGAACLATTLLSGGLATSAQAASSVDGYFIFHKNASDPSNSKLEWHVENIQTKKVLLSVNWRAGSGLGSTDDCAKNKGWLPNGRYGGTFHKAYNGSAVKGIVFNSTTKCRSVRPPGRANIT
jgi:hypothetical protein